MSRPSKVRDGHKHNTSLDEALLKMRTRNKEVCAGKRQGPLEDYKTLNFDVDSAGKSFKPQADEMLKRGTTEWFLSSQASNAEHHAGTPEEVFNWTQATNDLNSLTCQAYPNNSRMVCWLPQHPNGSMNDCISELRRCVSELGAVGCILNPDVFGGSFDAPPIYDEAWHPLYEELVKLQVPAMWHVTRSPKRQLHFTAAFYLMAGIMVQTQLSEGGEDLFKVFPELRMIFPHGAATGPYQAGRNEGISCHNEQELTKGCNPKMRPFVQFMESGNAFVDTVLMSQEAIDLLLQEYPKDALLFGSEMDGAARGVNPKTGQRFDDTLALIVSAVERRIITPQDADDVCWNNFDKAYPLLLKG